MTPRHSIFRLLITSFLLSALGLSQATVIQMDFAIGNQPAKQIFIELLDQPFPEGAPKTVENFLRYIEYTDPDTSEIVRRFDNTLIHRSIPGFVVQGGGFVHIPNPAGENFATDTSKVVIDKTASGVNKTVENEFDISRSNVRGTVAMAKQGGDPDSATSQWFINIGDNSGNLDNQNGGFTVFGRVIGMTASNTGDTVADEIEQLGTVDIRAVDPSFSAFSGLPLFGYTQGDPVPEITSANLVKLTRVTVLELVQPSILDFGLTAINSTSAAQTVTIENLTNTAFTINEIATDVLAAPFSLSSETCSTTTLLPGQTCTLFIEFTPTEAGQKNTSFSITTDSHALSSLSVSVTGSGAPQQPTISFSPTLGPTLQFGNLGPKQSDRILRVTISNLGIDVLTVDPRPFTGTGTGNLALANTCSAPLSIGDSCEISLTFSRLSAGVATEAQLEILSNDPDTPSSIIPITGSSSSDNDGVSDAIEAAVSSTGDGNLDGIADVLQDNVTSLPDTFGRYITLETEPGLQLVNVAAVESPAPDSTPRLASGGLDFRNGFFSFQLENIPVSGTATVTLYLPKGQTATNYFKFGRLPSDIVLQDPVLGILARPAHWYSFDYNGDTGAEILGDRIVLHFRDGGRGDDDLTVDGRIVDPGGPAVLSASGGSSGGGGGCNLSTAANGGKPLPVDFLLLLIGLFALWHIRKRCQVH